MPTHLVPRRFDADAQRIIQQRPDAFGPSPGFALAIARRIAQRFDETTALRALRETGNLRELSKRQVKSGETKAPGEAMREAEPLTEAPAGAGQKGNGISDGFHSKAEGILRRRGYIPERLWEAAIATVAGLASVRGERTGLEILENVESIGAVWKRVATALAIPPGNAQAPAPATAGASPATAGTSPASATGSTSAAAPVESSLSPEAKARIGALVGSSRYLTHEWQRTEALEALLKLAALCGEQAAVDVLARATSLHGIKARSTPRIRQEMENAKSGGSKKDGLQIDFSELLETGKKEWDYARIPKQTVIAIAQRLAERIGRLKTAAILTAADSLEGFWDAAEERIPGITEDNFEKLDMRTVRSSAEETSIAQLQSRARQIVHALVEALPQYREADRMDIKRMIMGALEHYRGDVKMQHEVISLVQRVWGVNDLRFQINLLIVGNEETGEPTEEQVKEAGKRLRERRAKEKKKKEAGKKQGGTPPATNRFTNARQWVHLDELERKFLRDFLELDERELERLGTGNKRIRQTIAKRLELLVQIPPHPERAQAYVLLLKTRFGIEQKGLPIPKQAERENVSHLKFRNQIAEAIYAIGDLAAWIENFDLVKPDDVPHIRSVDPGKIGRILMGEIR